MRTIPSELLDRVKKKWQVPAENAEPEMKVLLSRGFLNELFQVFTIQEGAELTDVDVTVKRVDTASIPAEAFALAINNGVAEVKSKLLPYDDQFPWSAEFTVASGVSAVAIEFDGYWDRDFSTRRFNFVTEEWPWLFYVISGSLYAQLWQGTPFVLATDVSKVAAIRGWLPANGDQSNDQGLIVAYLKTDGTMWYRAYCIQDELAKLWEVERQVTAFTGTITNLALFRTNDFRVGFIAEIAGETWWTLTTRNFAGMSYEPDVFDGHFLGVNFITLIPIEYIDTQCGDEYFSGSFNHPLIGIGDGNETPATVTANIVDARHVILTFTQPLTGDIVRIAQFITVSNEANTVFFPVESTSIGLTQSKLNITLSSDLATFNNTKISYNNSGIILTKPSQNMVMNVEPFNAVAPGLIPTPYHNEYFDGTFNGIKTIALTEILYSSTANQDEAYINGTFNGIKTITVTKVGGGDI